MFEGIKITDMISSASAFVAALTGVVMAFLAYRAYLKEPEQEDKVDSDLQLETGVLAPQELTIFQTSKQTTILRVTKNTLECEIKDDRPNKGGKQWHLSQEVCQNILKKRLVSANPNYKPRTGLLTIGPKPNWLYSKILFSNHTILEQDIYALLEDLA